MSEQNAPVNEKSITLTVEQAAALMQVSRPTLLNWTRRQDFPCFRVGRKILVVRRGLEAWATQQGEARTVL